jgi:predicted nucleotidyltransferase
MNVENILNELKKNLEEEFKKNFTGLVLFGSFAKGTQKLNSDIDILLTFNNLPQSRTKRFRLIRPIIMQLEEKYDIYINPVIAQEDKLSKSHLLLDIAQYAKILLDKNGKIKKHFEDIKNDYKNGLVKKIVRDNHYVLWISEKIET